jgi:PPK2 family polyphosphate:nucleotide phosphotransferase
MKSDDLRVHPDRPVRLADLDPRATPWFEKKSEARAVLEADIERLTKLQDVFAAARTHGLLIVLQGMDSAGKDGAVKHVMSGVNPQGVQVTAFKAPGPEELAHDFLWRANRALPARGHIGIFNRSHYEEVLVVRVHPECLERQHLPKELVGKRLWDQRLEAIAAFERYLTQQGTVVLKFFLNVSRQEQKRRFLERLEEKEKNWKFSASDLAERAFWDDYQGAYEEAIAATATPHAPWFVVPADHKWFTRLIVVGAMIEALDELNLKFPALSPDEQAAQRVARLKLESEEG